MGQAPSDESLTVLLNQWAQGDAQARDQVWDQLYQKLRNLAHHVLRSRRAGAGMHTTSLLHDAAFRLMNMEIAWQDRQHFLTASARCMRFTLVDDARKQLSQKRGSGQVDNELPDDSSGHLASEQNLEQVLAVHQALERLAAIDPVQEKLVELRYFAGMTVEETAEILGVSRPTVVRKWKAARIWLKSQLSAPLAEE